MKSIRQLLAVGLFALLSFLSSSVFALAVDDAVRVISEVNARQTPSTSGVSNGLKPVGSVGTIKTGPGFANPTIANGFTWWYVVWDSGTPVNGWSVESNLTMNTPVAKSFPIGSGIQVTTGNTNTRSSASTSASILQSMTVGSTGTVISGPAFANGYAWWQINWTSGPQGGWSVQDYLVSYTFPSTITGVSVSCSPTSLQANQTSQCTASVSGTGSYSSSVNWSIASGIGSVNANGLYSAPSPVTTTTTTNVRATSVQDGTKYGGGNITVNPSTPPTGTQAASNIFLDALGTGWYVGTWSGVTNNLTSPYAYRGDYGLGITTTSAWGRTRFLLNSGYKFSTGAYDSVSFNLNIGANEGEVLYVGLLDATGTAIAYVTVNSLQGVVLNSRVWQEIRVPLTSLGAANMDVYGFEIQSASPATWYIDQLKFELTNGVCQ